MNKNLIITALLVAVACQSVSAALPKDNVSVSMMSKMYTNVSSFVKNHKYACATVGVGALLVGGYKYLSKKLAQYNAQVEPQLDQLVAEVKQLVLEKNKYVTFEQIKAANSRLTIKMGKYVFLEAIYPKLIELANIYMSRMNDLLKPNMTPDQKVIAKGRAFLAAYNFNRTYNQ